MGELILCERPIAANPIFIEDAAINIYSLEELSYYIADNTYLLNADFISVELCNWIGRELGFKELEQQLLETIRAEAPLHIFVGQILSFTGYLTGQEIRKVLEIIASFENKSPAECQKMRADRLMEKDKLVDAIYEYEHMIDDGVLSQVSAQLEGDVWHNLGTAYGKLFFFEEATACFEEAYRRNHRQQSLRSMLAAMRCAKNEDGFQRLVEKYFVPEDLVQSIKQEVTDLSKQEKIRGFNEQIDRWQNHSVLNEMETHRVQEVIQEWKADYNHLCRI